MSKTPRTDAACGWPVGHHGRIESSDLVMDIAGPFVHSSVARELERENKQLRQTVLETLNQRGQRELIVAWDRAKELERENAALRSELKRQLALWQATHALGLAEREFAIKCIETALRKEAQP